MCIRTKLVYLPQPSLQQNNAWALSSALTHHLHKFYRPLMSPRAATDGVDFSSPAAAFLT